MNLESGLTPIGRTKVCQRCQQDKPLSEYHKDESRVDGHSYVCKACRRAHRRSYYEKQKERLREQYDPEQAREKRLVMKYGISNRDYLDMHEAQQSRCKICSSYSEKLFIDHCHINGNVRWLLCSPCNTSLAHFKDNPESLRAAADYLEGNFNA